jgi:5'-deoxynucleotidase YfbR-like HD superfamily hydrolase
MSEDIQEADRLPAPPDGEGSETEAQIRRILDKLQLLLRQRDLLLKENGKLKEELERLQELQRGHQTKLELLQQQVEVLGVTKAVMSDEEKKELEKRLGQYIREIDRCITLLGE